MKRLFVLLVLPVLAGCFTAQVPEVSRWLVAYVGPQESTVKATFGVARLAHVAVRAPYDSSLMAVLRSDGTIAFDAYNEFAATPAMLLKGLVTDALANSGLFKGVVGTGSVASAPIGVEVTLVRFALDCREEGARKATVELQVRLVENKQIVKNVTGSASVDAASGDYGKAFSAAASAAVSTALRQLR